MNERLVGIMSRANSALNIDPSVGVAETASPELTLTKYMVERMIEISTAPLDTNGIFNRSRTSIRAIPAKSTIAFGLVTEPNPVKSWFS